MHFIDFETSRPALPFHAGRRPYDQLLFQFSHHILEEDGSLRHANQCLATTPGIAPSIPVLRDLHAALSEDNGTVIHWWDHEKTVLSEIQRQLEASEGPNRESLSAFISTLIGHGTTPGRLADLGRLVLNTAFFQGTNGSSSIKKVLPAVLARSVYLRQRYGEPIYSTPTIPSLNFQENWTWLVENDGKIQDPYTLLKPLIPEPEISRIVSEAEDEETGNIAFIANGGAAMFAYGQLQDPLLPNEHRKDIESQLKCYCELDTLAMVMVFEALRDWLK